MTFQELEQKVLDLEKQIKDMSDVSLITNEQEQALIARGFISRKSTANLDGVLVGNGTSNMEATQGISVTRYGAGISGGAVTTPLVFVNGILTA